MAPRDTKASKSKRLSIGGSIATVGLVVGLAVTTRSAGADTGLGALVDERLSATRQRSADDGEPVGAARLGLQTESGASVDLAAQMALAGLALAGGLFAVAWWVRRNRERRMGEALGSDLSVRESVWLGRGQRILLVTFDTHKVLVGVSGGSLQNLGVFGEEGTVMPSPNNPIERDASLRRAEENHSSDFADMIKGELAETLGKANRPGRDRRRRMLSELSSL